MWSFTPSAILVFGLSLLAILVVSFALARRETLAEIRLLFDPRVLRLAIKRRSRRTIAATAFTFAAWIACCVYFLNIRSLPMLFVFAVFPAVMILLVRIAYLSMFDARTHRRLPDKLDDKLGD